MRLDLRKMSRKLSTIILFSLLLYLLRLFSFPFTYSQQADHLRWTLLVFLLFIFKFLIEFFEHKKRASALFLALSLSILSLFLYQYYRRLPKEEWTYEEAGVHYYVYPYYTRQASRKEKEQIAYWVFYYQDPVFEEYFFPEPVFVKYPETGKTWDDPSTEKHYSKAFAFLNEDPILVEVEEDIALIAKHRFEFKSEDYALVLRDKAMGQELWEIFIQKDHWESLGYLEENNELMEVIVKDEIVFFAYAPQAQRPLIYQSSKLPQMEKIHFDEVNASHLYLESIDPSGNLILSSAPWDQKESESVYELVNNQARFLGTD